MKIIVIGTGYVGLVTGTCFAEMGNSVTCIDMDKKKITDLNNGIIPIFEPGLEAMVKRNVAKGSLSFSTSLKNNLKDSKIAFIAVGTPSGEDGSPDLQYVLAVARELGQSMESQLVVVDKSTVPIGTGDKVKAVIQNELYVRGVNIPFYIVSNPEFLKEGAAVADFMKPDRVVIGSEDKEGFKLMRTLYSPFIHNHDRLIEMDIRSAEMTKYAANAMLATKISFMNEVANICERVGADINQVRIGIGSDSRIGYSFIYPGAGYGGSCFPKDVKALKKIAEEHDYDSKLIRSVEEVNDAQKFVISEKVVKRYGENLEGKIFALWGLAFKPETDDMREAPAIYVVNELVRRGAKIQAYDPKAMYEAQEVYLKGVENITYCSSKYEALEGADAMILLTEWKEFRSPDFEELNTQLKDSVIFDGRNQYNAFNLGERGFEYHQIGKI
jgi:UDPglucose 6-dehydrogenase